MKPFGKISLNFAAMLLFIICARADDVPESGNPYASVAVRNVFGLTSIKAVVTTQATEPQVRVIPNGIISIFGQAQVLFKAVDKTGKESAYIFTEGQEHDGIEVIRIDWRKSLVTFKNHGLIQTLPLVGVSLKAVFIPNPQ